jgi:predicted ATPase
MLLGASGSGKTYSIRTLLDAGLEVFVLFTEPGMEVLADCPRLRRDDRQRHQDQQDVAQDAQRYV